jgi:hypothetical protein
LGMSPAQAVAFALLSRVLLIVEDLAGVPQIAKSASGIIFGNKHEQSGPQTQSTTL